MGTMPEVTQGVEVGSSNKNKCPYLLPEASGSVSEASSCTVLGLNLARGWQISAD